MKKLLAVLVLCATLVGCAEDNQYGQAYGLANQDTRKTPDAVYEIKFESVAMAIIFSETIIVPVYVVGWNLYEAVGKKK